ncbi:MAG TPA: fumarate reductase (quinol) flavoprotein subunit [Methylomirabilota bacterium]|jgi:fumarate reductase flavoprotein subunit|nr:fumarate reductase (quinol) flavoprotein subunit [Methylomirabilota bacterium]
MPGDNGYQHDILVIGGGGAGLRAAIAAVTESNRLSVAVLSKVYPMRSHTVSAEGGLAAVMRDNDSLDTHAKDTIFGSDFLADQDVVETFVKEAPGEAIQLEHWGCPWSRDPDGRMSVRPFGGMTVNRTLFAADKTGFHLLHALFQTSLKYDQIVRYDEWFATSLLVEEGRVCGVSALNVHDGQLRAITAKSVILCTGGGGRIYPFTTNAAIKTGDGMALAYRAGVPLKDMEFVQYHPTGLPGTGILITEAARGEGGHLKNKDGYRYLQDYGLGPPTDTPVHRKMELGPRDILSRCHIQEHLKGRTFEGPHGHYVHLDLRHLGEKLIDKKLPFVRELAKNYVGIDPVYEPIPVRPVVHYMMGGVSTDVTGKTVLEGLYAAGETACVSINGANRLGSNSLTEIVVFGNRAGRSAARYALERPAPKSNPVAALVNDERSRIDRRFLRSEGKERIADVRESMQQAMEKGVGIYRDKAGMEETCQALRELRARFARVGLWDRDAVFNTELIAALELDSMLDVAESVANSALKREESRGSHTRTDFPKRDDERFLRHTLAYRTADGPPRIEYLPVTITRWAPEERKY